MAMRGSLVGTIFFWIFVLGASSGAFVAGFYYTFGATVDVHTKSPIAETTPKPGSVHLPGVKPSPTATPTLAPGPLPITTPSATMAPPRGTPTPMAMGGFPQPSLAPTATPAPVRTPAPAATSKEEIYRVQVGAFDSREAAQKQVEELQTVGINAVVVYDGGAYHAQLGAFSDRARAISVADEVNTRGYSVTIRH